MGEYWIKRTLQFVEEYWLPTMIVLVLLAEIRRWTLPKFERLRQDIGSIWGFVAAIAVIVFLFWFYKLAWAADEAMIMAGIMAAMALRSIVSGIRLRYYKPPKRDSDSIGPTAYK